MLLQAKIRSLHFIILGIVSFKKGEIESDFFFSMIILAAAWRIGFKRNMKLGSLLGSS